ncbi:hypothetical protein ACFV3A_32815, partial [Streptomyces microflavus]
VHAPAPSAQLEKRARHRQRGTMPSGPSEQVRVQQMLSYLAAALPAQTSAPARLLALQCALRSTAAGKVEIPTGLVRGMRLGRGATALAELQDARWLYSPTPPGGRGGGFTAQLLDAAVRMQTPTVKDRSRAADWILRTCQRKELRELDALPRLLALALAVHAPSGQSGAPASAEQEVLARMCGLPAQGLIPVLNALVSARFLRSWVPRPASEELLWEVAVHECLTGISSGRGSDGVTYRAD